MIKGMTVVEAKVREADLVRLILVDQDNPLLRRLQEVLQLQEYQALQALVSCPLSDLPQAQAKVQALRHLCNKFTVKDT